MKSLSQNPNLLACSDSHSPFMTFRFDIRIVDEANESIHFTEDKRSVNCMVAHRITRNASLFAFSGLSEDCLLWLLTF